MASIFRKHRGLTFDDVLLVPQHSTIKSRMDVDLSTKLGHLNLKIPIVSANMDRITGLAMAVEMAKLGGLGIFHRYTSIEVVSMWIDKMLHFYDHPPVPSIGISKESFEAAKTYFKLGCQAICIDVAHGDTDDTIDMVKRVRDAGYKTVIAGNVATQSGAMNLYKAGANVIKVGIAGGSVCHTKYVAGAGVPQLTAILECAEKLPPGVQVIGDGGIKTSADIVKALAVGAHAVMVGSLLAGTEETPGDKIYNGQWVKEYRGMASEAAMSDFGLKHRTPEGVSVHVPYKGPVAPVIEDLVGGVKSGFSYQNAKNLSELHEHSEFIEVSPSTTV